MHLQLSSRSQSTNPSDASLTTTCHIHTLLHLNQSFLGDRQPVPSGDSARSLKAPGQTDTPNFLHPRSGRFLGAYRCTSEEAMSSCPICLLFQLSTMSPPPWTQKKKSGRPRSRRCEHPGAPGELLARGRKGDPPEASTADLGAQGPDAASRSPPRRAPSWWGPSASGGVGATRDPGTLRRSGAEPGPPRSSPGPSEAPGSGPSGQDSPAAAPGRPAGRADERGRNPPVGSGPDLTMMRAGTGGRTGAQAPLALAQESGSGEGEHRPPGTCCPPDRSRCRFAFCQDGGPEPRLQPETGRVKGRRAGLAGVGEPGVPAARLAPRCCVGSLLRWLPRLWFLALLFVSAFTGFETPP